MLSLFNIIMDLIGNLWQFIDVIIKIPLTFLQCCLSLFGSFSEELAYLIVGIIIFGLVFGFIKFITPFM